MQCNNVEPPTGQSFVIESQTNEKNHAEQEVTTHSSSCRSLSPLASSVVRCRSFDTSFFPTYKIPSDSLLQLSSFCFFFRVTVILILKIVYKKNIRNERKEQQNLYIFSYFIPKLFDDDDRSMRMERNEINWSSKTAKKTTTQEQQIDRIEANELSSLRSTATKQNEPRHSILTFDSPHNSSSYFFLLLEQSIYG